LRLTFTQGWGYNNDLTTKELNMFDRDALIEKLVSDDLAYFTKTNALGWLSMILRDGKTGYNNMSDEELITECLERKISPYLN
jgi:hypothetical protein